MNNEIKRIMDGPAADELPSGMGIIEYRLNSSDEISVALQRVRYLLSGLLFVDKLMDVAVDEDISGQFDPDDQLDIWMQQTLTHWW